MRREFSQWYTGDRERCDLAGNSNIIIYSTQISIGCIRSCTGFAKNKSFRTIFVRLSILSSLSCSYTRRYSSSYVVEVIPLDQWIAFVLLFSELYLTIELALAGFKDISKDTDSRILDRGLILNLEKCLVILHYIRYRYDNDTHIHWTSKVLGLT